MMASGCTDDDKPTQTVPCLLHGCLDGQAPPEEVIENILKIEVDFILIGCETRLIYKTSRTTSDYEQLPLSDQLKFQNTAHSTENHSTKLHSS